MATVERPAGRRVAYIQVRDDFFEMPADRQRHIVAHELTHVLMNEGEAVMLDGAAELSPAGAAFAKAFIAMHEYGVDRIAGLLVNLLPLPDLPRHRGDPA